MTALNTYGSGVLKGLSVTLRHFWGTIFTDVRKFPHRYITGGTHPTRGDPFLYGTFSIQYPEERVPMLPRFRGPLMHLRDAETGEPRCTACGLCARACPHGCITVEGEGKGKERKPSRYEYNVGKCVFCRQCVEACAFNAIELSHNYELACYEKDTIWGLERLLKLGDAEEITEHGQFWGET